MKTIHESESNNRDNSLITKVVEHNGKKFRLSYENRNGSRGAYIKIIVDDGSLAQVASNRDVSLGVDVSYVADIAQKRTEAKAIFRSFEAYIKKVY